MFGTAHWTGVLAILVVALLLFGGKGKISGVMGDLARGITSFRKGLKEGGEGEARPSLSEGGAMIEADRTSDRSPDRTKDSSAS